VPQFELSGYGVFFFIYCCPPVWGLGEGLTTPRRKKEQLVTKCNIGNRKRAVVNTVMNILIQ